MRFIEKEKCKGVAEREQGGREIRGAFLYMWMATKLQVKVGGEPNGFWEYGGCCLGNRCSDCTYVMSWVSEVLIPTLRMLNISLVFPGHSRFIEISLFSSDPYFN